MKRTVVISCVLCLLVGLSAGLLLPAPWEEAAPAAGTIVKQPAASSAPANGSPLLSSPSPTPLDPSDNYTLLGAAGYAAEALRDRDYAALSTLVHPEKGVTFTPYSTVDRELDQVLSKEQVAGLAEDSTVYTWGTADGSGELLQMTAAQYMARFVFDADYTKAPQIGIDRVMVSGNALENVEQAYPDCRFVDFSFPGKDMDWTSLKLVFEPGETEWLLVGIIHGQWTI